MRGFPGRYVSGYLVPGSDASPDIPDFKQEDVIGGQATHAWTEILLPNNGWMPLDPTLGKAVGLRHVRIAYGRDYGDVAPVRGVYKGHAGQSLSVDVRVRPALDDSGCRETQRDYGGKLRASFGARTSAATRPATAIERNPPQRRQLLFTSPPALATVN